MAVPRFWREIPSRYNLVGTRCGNCNEVFFPPRLVCPRCRRMGKLEPKKLSGRGKIVSFTVTHVPPEGFEDQVPYVLAIIQLEEGPKLTAQLTDCDPNEVKMGDEVEMVFRRMGEDGERGILYYGYKGRLLRANRIESHPPRES